MRWAFNWRPPSCWGRLGKRRGCHELHIPCATRRSGGSYPADRRPGAGTGLRPAQLDLRPGLPPEGSARRRRHPDPGALGPPLGPHPGPRALGQRGDLRSGRLCRHGGLHPDGRGDDPGVASRRTHRSRSAGGPGSRARLRGDQAGRRWTVAGSSTGGFCPASPSARPSGRSGSATTTTCCFRKAASARSGASPATGSISSTGPSSSHPTIPPSAAAPW